MCMFSQIKVITHIKQNVHSIACAMSRGWNWGYSGFKNLSVGICDGPISTARSIVVVLCLLFVFYALL